ncbi:MAG TPA: DUF3467 domain-containing protein [Pyrinomonadaceae bacterium]|nr:DUF3467 domain-containing protein [Pyrinomonadaceae bacterium]
MAENKEPETKTWDRSNIEFIQERVPSVYANNSGVSFTNWDASIEFGEILGEVEGKLRILPKVRVTMSLQHAKAFLDLFKASLEGFENRLGKIQVMKSQEGKM